MRLEVSISVKTPFALLAMWSAKCIGSVLWVQIWALHRVFRGHPLERNLQNTLSLKNCHYEIAPISRNLPRAPASVWILQRRGKWRGRGERPRLGKIRLPKMPTALSTILSEDKSRKSTWHEKTARRTVKRASSLNTKNRKSVFTNPIYTQLSSK